MKYLLTALCLVCFAIGCGEDDPASSAGRPVLKNSFTLNGGQFQSFSFQIDLDIERNVSIQGEFSVQGGNVSFAILTENHYQLWQQGQTYTTVYSPGVSSGHSFSRISLSESGVYYLVFINVQASTPVTVTTDFSVVGFVEQAL